MSDMERETESELAFRVEEILGAELNKVLLDASVALERLAPAEFETIGTKAMDLDQLMINATATAALPELMARFRVSANARRTQRDPYRKVADDDFTADSVSARAIEETNALLRAIAQLDSANHGETSWNR